MITQAEITRAMTYGDYRKLLETLMAEGKTTGPNQNEDYFNYAKLNLQRMQRLDKTVVLNPDLLEALQKIRSNYIWLVLTEGWCGDAAQNLPVFAAIEKACNKITLKLFLRDENLEVMDRYLTGTSRSIPKLICVKSDSLEEVFIWGPRPNTLQELMIEQQLKEKPLAEKSLIIQKWYNADKTQSVQNEFLELMKLLE